MAFRSESRFYTSASFFKKKEGEACILERSGAMGHGAAEATNFNYINRKLSIQQPQASPRLRRVTRQVKVIGEGEK